MKQRDAIEVLFETRGRATVITGPGSSSGMLYALGHQQATIYNMELGYATAICLGIALGAPDVPVISLEGDGSLLAGIGVLSTINRYRPANLVVFLMDNGVYATIGSGALTTATSTGTDLCAVARACGFNEDQVVSTNDRSMLLTLMEKALNGDGPWLVRAVIDEIDPNEKRTLPGVDVVESSVGFRQEMVRRGYDQR